MKDMNLDDMDDTNHTKHVCVGGEVNSGKMSSSSAPSMVPVVIFSSQTRWKFIKSRKQMMAVPFIFA